MNCYSKYLLFHDYLAGWQVSIWEQCVLAGIIIEYYGYGVLLIRQPGHAYSHLAHRKLQGLVR